MIRMTTTTVLTLRLLMQKEQAACSVMAETGIEYRTAYRILHRLESCGWLESFWESETDARDAGRPRRRYYKLTKLGRKQARSRVEQ